MEILESFNLNELLENQEICFWKLKSLPWKRTEF